VDDALTRAVEERDRGWVAQRRTRSGARCFRLQGGGVACRTCWSISPRIFPGRLAGFLTRLSATGLANVVRRRAGSAFVVSKKNDA
jgi:hypothetical protein